MRVLSLEISNILSIESASLSFQDKGLVLVEGWNHDTGRANGAGKTAIFNCLSFALYDKLPRKITASEILRRDAKHGYAKCSVICGEDTWTVERHRPKGVKFFKNGVEQNIGQSEFESLIRLSYDQFLLTIYTPQANSGNLSRFLASPDSSKKEFILQLLNLEQFSAYKKLIDKQADQISKDIELDLNKIEISKSKIDAYTQSLINIEVVGDSIAVLEKSIDSLEKEILELSKTPKPDLTKYAKIEEGVRSKQLEFMKAKTKRSMLMDLYREQSSLISLYAGETKCSECGNIVDTTDARIKHEEHQEKVKQKVVTIKSQIDECDSLLKEENSIIELSRKLKDKKAQESHDYDTASQRISELRSLVKTKTIQVENLTLKLNSDSELRNKINDLDSAISVLMQGISNKKQDLELYKTLSAIYSPTGAQAYVLDSVVDSFNEVVQKYIDILWPNASYILNSYKETSKKEVVAKFSETLTLDGKEVSVGSLSGGELKGLSLCIDFALLDVLETQFGLSLNPIILDEPFDGLDAVGREIVISLLEQLAKGRQIFVVDHASEAKTLFTNSLFIEKRNGISSIV